MAQQRFDAALLLLKHSFHLESIYLAGYAVECDLKALLLRLTPRREHEDIILREFRGRHGHDLNRLRTRLRQRGVNIPAEIAMAIRRAADWSTEFRYETGLKSRREAQNFLDAVQQIRQWVERSL